MEVHEKGNAPSQSLSELRIVTIMSVPPLKVTEPRRVLKVLVSDELTSAIQGCYQIVLCYENLKEGDHGWCMAGWIVESLARVLLDHPLLAGRLHRRDGTGFEIVANDSGVRLLEACYPTSLSHFLELNERNQHLKTELVFWKEIDEQCPQFSPLFYVQVTNFECGGYVIGISCSLLLAEVFLVENFLGKWAEIHNNMSVQRGEIKTPIFYHPPIENSKSLPSVNRSPSQNWVQSLVLKMSTEDVNSREELWMICVEEAKRKLGTDLGSEICVVVKESSEVIKVESWSMNGWSRSKGVGLKLKHEMTESTWEEFGVKEVTFNEGNKPVHVSSWIDSVRNGYVMTVPLHNLNLNLNLKNNACAVIVISPSLSLL